MNKFYICPDCAKKRFGKDAKVNVGCTWHEGKCDFCKKKKSLCHVNDYKQNSKVWD